MTYEDAGYQQEQELNTGQEMEEYATISDGEKLLTIMRVMNSKTFGLRFSEKIVGGRARLEHLITTGKIRAEKGSGTAQNGKWLVNAADVLKYARAK